MGSTIPGGRRRYGGKSADERREERRTQLLDAGLELFGTVGYASTTIEALCATAGLNPRYFYEQFGSRQALLLAVYDRHVDHLIARVAAAVEAAPPDPRSRLEAGLRIFISLALADERMARINYFEMVGVSSEVEARRRAVLRAFAEMAAGELRAAEVPEPLRSTDDRVVAVALVGAVDGLVIDSLASAGEGPSPDEIVETVLTVFGAALGQSDPGLEVPQAPAPA